MADVDLLPLYAELQGHPKIEIIKHYARANVAHATAEKDAEIEALRAEVAAWRELSDHVRAGACNAIWPDRYTDARTRDVAAALKRAERLAEALRNSSDALERLAFAIRAPNAHTPQLVELAIAMRATALAALRDHDKEVDNG